MYLFRLLTPLLLLLVTNPTSAQQTKIAFVDVEEVFTGSVTGQHLSRQFEREVKRLEGVVQAEEEKFQEVSQRIQRKGSTLSEAELNQLNNELEDRHNGLKRMREDAGRQMQKLREDMLGRFQQQVYKVIQTISQERNLDLVLTSQGSSVLYLNNRINITGEVMQRVDAP